MSNEKLSKSELLAKLTDAERRLCEDKFAPNTLEWRQLVDSTRTDLYATMKLHNKLLERVKSVDSALVSFISIESDNEVRTGPAHISLIAYERRMAFNKVLVRLRGELA